MLWVRGVPLFEGNLFDLTLRDLLDLDLFLASLKAPQFLNPRYKGDVRHWWQIPASAEEFNEMAPEGRGGHPDAMLLLAVRVLGSYRASGRPDSLDSILDSGLQWDEVIVTSAPNTPVEDNLPRGFRAGNTQHAMPDVDGMDLNREVSARFMDIALMFGWTLADVYRLPLYVWLGVAAQVDAAQKG
jgi:hypothetical protein